MSNRTFKLTSPLMHGRDVVHFQSSLNQRFHDWDVGCFVDLDGAYGSHTVSATERVMYGLGIARRELDHGVTPELRMKLHDPSRCSRAERARAGQRQDWIRRMRDRHAGHGPAAAIAYARKHAGICESPPNSNRGPLIDQWQRLCGVSAAPWCGCFANACLMAAGFPTQPWLRYCPWIEGRARSGEAGWSWHGAGDAKPGDLILFGRGIAMHVEVSAGGGLTYGGNTSSGAAGSQDNGGGVYARRRNFGDPGFPARGAARPPYRGR